MTTRKATDIKAELISRGWRFSFFQALRLLGHTDTPEAGFTPDADETIRIRPKFSLTFPPADIDRIEPLKTDQGMIYRLTATFLGLYGTSSPLPTFYTEDLLAEAAQDESVSRDFLDIFHHRLYTLLFQGWLKYRQYLQIVEQANHLHLERLYCLLGLGHEILRRDMPNAFRLLRYVGLFSQFPRSAMGLATLLRDALQGVPLCIVPCISRKAKIPEPQRLRLERGGRSLGFDSYVGEEIEDRMGKFRVQIGPLNKADFLRFTPGSSGYTLLVSLTELYITEPLAYEVELILAAREAQTVCLADRDRAVLGVTTWVFSEAFLGEVRTRFTVHRS